MRKTGDVSEKTRSQGRTKLVVPLREGTSLLQSLASCGHCGRRLHTLTRLRTGLSLLLQCSRRWPWGLLPQHRWQTNRRGRHTGRHRSPRAGQVCCHCRCRRTTRDGSQRGVQALAPWRRAGHLRGAARRAPLSRCRSQQSPRRPRSRARVGGTSIRGRGGKNRTRPPRARAPARAEPRRARSTIHAWVRPRHRVAFTDDHTARPQ
jgi:hypothetical protein